MSYTYANRKRTDSAVANKEAVPQGPSMDALRSGAASPTQEQMGSRVDLPDAIREKMEASFGADLSAVRLYESQAVADAGANAVAQGANIAFAPGMLDFTSFGGQALLGHEISHVVSQARGEVTGGGFLNDHALEARADQEGAMAAAGQTVAMPTAAMSTVSAANAAGPMQADKKARKAAKEKAARMKTAEAGMLKLDSSYDKGSMTSDIAALQPVLSEEIAGASAGLSVDDGNRFGFMRNDATIASTTPDAAKLKDHRAKRNAYLKHMKEAGRATNVKMLDSLSQDLGSLPLGNEGSYKGIRANEPELLSAYQDRAVAQTQAYLDMLSQDENAMDALRQSSSMYASLGTYSETNKQGMVGGQLEADHRAMNDMLLRSLGPDIAMGSQHFGLSGDDRKKSFITQQAMSAMQPAILTTVMDPSKKDSLTPQEAQMAAIYEQFFAKMHGGNAQDTGAAPAPQQPSGPVGQGSEETLSYRSPEIAKLANDPRYTPDPTSSDSTEMAVIARRQYDKVKSLQGSGDEAAIREAMESFKAARERMGYK